MSCYILLLFCACVFVVTAHYDIGTGMADITGPVAELSLMGYAKQGQVGEGLLQRLYARTYIISDGSKRIVFVNTDTQSMGDIIKMRVVNKLQSRFGNELYNVDNVMISSTHSHSGVAGYLQHALYELPSWGWLEEVSKPLIKGIVRSITRAHDNLCKGDVRISMDELFDTNINRSPAAYLLNPVEERRQYTYDVDKLMTVLGFRTDSGTDLGLISWFAVHGVTVNNTNRLVNGDNKGYASYVTEKHFQKDQDPRFVAAFAQSNEGDVSPHTLGAFCSGTEIPCDGSYANKCPFRSRCIGRGPGWEMGHYETNRIIGQNQATKAIELFRQQRDMPTYVSGVIDFRHQYWDITKATVRTTDGDLVHPCLPAMGYGFAAGTTDGPAVRGLYQNMTKGTLLWGTLAHLLRWPSQQQKLCHAPKPIILNTGEMTYPFEWQPHILDIQLLRIGSVFIIGVPAEFTTMSGRRLRNAVQKTLCEYGICDTVVILSGPANGYSSYVATFEEYQMQRFEGAATAYGPHTLQAYVDAFKTLAKSMALEDPSMIQSEKFRDFTPQAFNFVTRHGADRPKLFHHFGDIVSDVDVQYNRRLNQTVSATFVAGNPRNNVLHEGTFLTVERKTPQGTWSVVRTDNDYDTRFRWRYTSKLFGQSEATIEWDIHEHTEPGTYRLVYYGHNKESLKRTIRPHSGQSSEFTVY